MFFSNVTRPEVVAENPDLKIGPVAKILGARWNSMGEVDRAPYQKMADDDKLVYVLQNTVRDKDIHVYCIYIYIYIYISIL